MSKLRSSCSLRFPPSTLPWHLRSAFLLASSDELLQDLCGESAPYQTRLFVRTAGRVHELVQFMQLEEDIVLIVTGPHAAQVCERLPDFTRKRVSEITFDEDGYSQDPPDTRSLESSQPQGVAA